MKCLLFAVASGAVLLSACGQSSNDATEERVEKAAEASASAAGTTVVALGLSEAQLLDADLVGPDKVELGDVTSIVRGTDGQVERLLVEVEDSNPDRFVHIPIIGLTVVTRGNDADLSTTMTKEEIAALPDVVLTSP